jgi:hypothetical protein
MPTRHLHLIFGEGVFTFETLSRQSLTGTLDMGGGYVLDLTGSVAHHWPDGVDQVAALVGSVIRAKPHGSAPAGHVASFIAVART